MKPLEWDGQGDDCESVEAVVEGITSKAEELH